MGQCFLIVTIITDVNSQYIQRMAFVSSLCPSVSMLAAAVAVIVLSLSPNKANGYCTGDLNRKDIAGVWSLKSQSFLPALHPPTPDPSRQSKVAAEAKKLAARRPLKEFTKWPKKKKKIPTPSTTAIEEEELLLMLRDDGSFIQYGKITPEDVPGDDDDAQNKKKPAFVTEKSSSDVNKNDEEDTTGVMKGTWDFIDGKLILAADRPQDIDDLRNIQHDTILVGDVVVKSEVSLEENRGEASAAMDSQNDTNDKNAAAATSNAPADSTNDNKKKDYGNNDDGSYDVHISVPDGTVEIGKFMYPKKHPSFFEQPIYKPTPTGSFQLRQVLGSLNTRTKKDEEPVEKFKFDDLKGKRYFLATYPLEQRRKKMTDVKPHERAEVEKKIAEEESRPVPIRAVQIELFANMTFSTIGGLGDSKILRGKWNIIGAEKDQLWMQVLRFGFGRSVSGSTYSEGSGLTHEDQKAYWGRILDINDSTDGNDSTEMKANAETPRDSDEPKTVEINGSVLDGWGLEPLPVARFTMIEETQEYDDDDEDMDDDEEEMFRQLLENHADFGGTGDDGGDGVEDDPFSSLDAFQ